MLKETALRYFSIPRDFPRANLLEDVLFNYELCEEFVSHVLKEIREEQLRSPLIATPEIVERHLEVARQYGWGCFPGEIEWIFRNVVRELGCDMPGSLIR
jgi:hypothetical protein